MVEEPSSDEYRRMLAPLLLIQHPPSPQTVQAMLNSVEAVINPNSPASFTSSMAAAEENVLKLRELGIHSLDEHAAIFDLASRRRFTDFAIEFQRISARMRKAIELCDYQEVKGLGTYHFKRSASAQERKEALEALGETFNMFNQAGSLLHEFSFHCQKAREAVPVPSAWESMEAQQRLADEYGKQLPPGELLKMTEEILGPQGISIVQLMGTLALIESAQQNLSSAMNMLALCATGISQNLQASGPTSERMV